jgi:hypothetical protein
MLSARPMPYRTAPHSACEGVASLEFALIAPLMAIMLMSVFDGSRALIAWQQTSNASQAIAEAAEKLSVSQSSSATALTSIQMQNAMTSIYAEMPGLAAGTNGTLPGKFSVTLSEIEYYPQCDSSDATDPVNSGGCGITPQAPQIPYTYWSTYLTQGGPNLVASASNERPCGPLTPVYPSWTTTNANLTPLQQRLKQMVDPSHGGTINISLTPQVVADVQYQFTPTFAQMFATGTVITFLSSSIMATPFGNNEQLITYAPAAGDSTVTLCPIP